MVGKDGGSRLRLFCACCHAGIFKLKRLAVQEQSLSWPVSGLEGPGRQLRSLVISTALHPGIAMGTCP